MDQSQLISDFDEKRYRRDHDWLDHKLKVAYYFFRQPFSLKCVLVAISDRRRTQNGKPSDFNISTQNRFSKKSALGIVN